MQIWENIKRAFQPSQKRSIPNAGRVSTSKFEIPPFSRTIVSPPTPEQFWRVEELDTKTLAKLPVSRLVTLLADLSPEVSKALYDFQRFANPSFALSAKQPGSNETHADGQASIGRVLQNLDLFYGSRTVPVDRVFLSTFLRGAVFGEMVIHPDTKQMIDLATPDPIIARFRGRQDRIRGDIWELGQYVNGIWVDLSQFETVRYIPIDPFPGNPYGRPLVSPAVFTSLFLLGILHDLRLILAQQGWHRLDIILKTENLDFSGLDEKEQQDRLDALLTDISNVYGNLKPDQAYVHSDSIELGRPVGTVEGSNLTGIDAVFRTLERMAIRSLKTMPLLMGSNETVTETSARRQWEIYVESVRSVQRNVATAIESLFKTGLEAEGIQADVEMSFGEIRRSERLTDAEAEKLEIENEAAKRDHGWQTNDEAAEEIVGHEAIREVKPSKVIPISKEKAA